MTSQQLLDVSSKLCDSLQKYGAETYRVEDSVERILTAHGASEINVFVINSCCMISFKDQSGQVSSNMLRCGDKTTDLYKLDKLNALSRKLCSEPMIYEDIISEIDKINQKKVYPMYVKLLAFTLISTSFCYLFGGNATEIIAAGAVSVVVYPMIYLMDSLKTGIFFKNIIASAIIALLTLLFSSFIAEIRIDKSIIGTFMNLVPGVALVNSMRDIIAGDLISGKNTLTEAILIALGMALGSGLVISLLTRII